MRLVLAQTWAPTWCIDTDHPVAYDYSGVQGCICDILYDLEIMFDGIDLGSMPIIFHYMYMCAMLIFAAYMVMAQRRGYDISQLRRSIINAPYSTAFLGAAPSSQIPRCGFR
ncbi:MAG: methylmalonyl-CoA mutase family protein [Thermodesulfobacteriota bacterium]|nr:methylmalonyl-CoA mutase family protein [Thermodesulfobacteriota bacterium]